MHFECLWIRYISSPDKLLEVIDRGTTNVIQLIPIVGDTHTGHTAVGRSYYSVSQWQTRANPHKTQWHRHVSEFETTHW